MAIKIKPQVEANIRTRAALEGVTVDELLERTFSTTALADTHSRLDQYLRKIQVETGGVPMPPGGKYYSSVGDLLAEWTTEDAMLTDEERAKSIELWKDMQNVKRGVEI